jgi:hypothetical protein
MGKDQALKKLLNSKRGNGDDTGGCEILALYKRWPLGNMRGRKSQEVAFISGRKIGMPFRRRPGLKIS